MSLSNTHSHSLQSSQTDRKAAPAWTAWHHMISLLKQLSLTHRPAETWPGGGGEGWGQRSTVVLHLPCNTSIDRFFYMAHLIQCLCHTWMYFHAYKHKLNSEPWLSNKTNFLMDLNCSTQKQKQDHSTFCSWTFPPSLFHVYCCCS